MENTTKTEFAIELAKLLEKYDASICWGCHPGSDTHGISGEYILCYSREGDMLKIDGHEIDSPSIIEEIRYTTKKSIKI